MPKQVPLGRTTFSLFFADSWGKGSSGSLSTVIVVIDDVATGTELLVDDDVDALFSDKGDVIIMLKFAHSFKNLNLEFRRSIMRVREEMFLLCE